MVGFYLGQIGCLSQAKSHFAVGVLNQQMRMVGRMPTSRGRNDQNCVKPKFAAADHYLRQPTPGSNDPPGVTRPVRHPC